MNGKLTNFVIEA